MKYQNETCEIIYNKKIAESTFDMLVKSDFIAANALCGQFVNILCEGKTLRRPISICEVDKSRTIRLVYQVKGEGTKWMSEQRSGDKVEVFGPLGKGFNVKNNALNTVIIGGGIGTPPMLESLKSLNGNADVILGFRNKDFVILEDDFNKIANSVTVCTDDGSYKEHGFVTDALIRHIQNNKCDQIMACGPIAMLRAIAGIAMDHKIPCQVSLEERMGCGIGACLVCVCKIRIQGFDGYQQVCKSGPVFDAKSIVWYETRQIDLEEFEIAKAIRHEVFCNEQGYDPNDEFDELDKTSMHFVSYDGKKPIATSRIVNIGNDIYKIGRIAVLHEYRGRGAGKNIVSDLIKIIKDKNGNKIMIDAQTRVVGFYQKLGFKPYGDEHMDGHVPHTYMQLEL